MLSCKREHDFSGSEVLGEVSGGLPEELLGTSGTLMLPNWDPRAPEGPEGGLDSTQNSIRPCLCIPRAAPSAADPEKKTRSRSNSNFNQVRMKIPY